MNTQWVACAHETHTRAHTLHTGCCRWSYCCGTLDMLYCLWDIVILLVKMAHILLVSTAYLNPSLPLSFLSLPLSVLWSPAS